MPTWVVPVGLVGLLAAIGAFVMLRPGTPTPPTEATLREGRLQRIDQPASLWSVVERPTKPGLAADDYNKGVVEYYDTNGYETLRGLSEDEKLAISSDAFPYEVCGFVLAGAAKRRMDYVVQYVPPAEAVKPSHRELISDPDGKPPLPHLSGFRAMADAALLYARICERADKHSEAERLSKAVLVFGWHVAEDRVRLFGHQIGLEIERKAAEQLAEHYERRKATNELTNVRAFLADLTGVQERVSLKAAEAVFRLNKRGHLHAGDLMNVAGNDGDPMWRIEAIRMLGVSRAALTQGGKRADFRAITDLLERYRAGEIEVPPPYPPFARAAAERALGMTIKDVRTAY